MTTEMKVSEKPILFSGSMVRAIMDGRKTQTRRVVKPQPVFSGIKSWERGHWAHKTSDDTWDYVVPVTGGTYWANTRNGPWRCPYGERGTKLWVRETWRPGFGDGGPAIEYPADGYRLYVSSLPQYEDSPGSWWATYFNDRPRSKPSIHMPRWASRITLEVVNVWVERLQYITEEDAQAEGIVRWESDRLQRGDRGATQDFRFLWDSINAKRGFGWDANPWVWVIEFRRIEP